MANDDEKGGEVRFTVSAETLSYLTWLTRHTVLGRTTNEVAQHILTQRLSEMRGEDFNDGQRR